MCLDRLMNPIKTVSQMGHLACRSGLQPTLHGPFASCTATASSISSTLLLVSREDKQATGMLMACRGCQKG